MITHKITLPNGTLIEFFSNADEVGQLDLDEQAIWNNAANAVKKEAKRLKKRNLKRQKMARRKQR